MISKILEVINALGPSEESAVSKLRELRMKGRRGSSCSCVLAKYISINVGFKVLVSPSVDIEKCGIVTFDLESPKRKTLKLPKHLWKLMYNFDRYKYTDLLE